MILVTPRYAAYGPSAWAWESAELCRKLVLMGLLVLLQAQPAVQVSCLRYLSHSSLYSFRSPAIHPALERVLPLPATIT